VASGIVVCCSGLLLLAAPALRRCDHIAVSAADSKSDDSSNQDASSGKATASERVPNSE